MSARERSAGQTIPANGRSFSINFIAATVAMTSVTYGFGRYAYGLFLPSIREDFQLTTFELGLIASINTGLYLLATLAASASAIYFRPRTFMLASGVITTTGLAIVGLAQSLPLIMLGIFIAGIGGGILSPALFEAVEAWLPHRWKNRAIAALNAGATPGLVLTGLAAYWMEAAWQGAWLVMAAIGVTVTIWNLAFLPGHRLARFGSAVKLKLERKIFARSECYPLYLTIFVYGILMSVYLTFSVDVIVTSGKIGYPTDRLFWVLLGVAGLPAVFTGEFITRFGVRALLLISIPMCGMSYLLLAAAPDNIAVVLISAVLFGLASIVPGGGLLVWSIGLFRDRPSIASGIVFFLLSVSLVIGPTLYGLTEAWVGQTFFFFAVAGLAIVIIPLFPREVFDTSAARLEAACAAGEVTCGALACDGEAREKGTKDE